jgi:uncharacterized membrane protein YgcG
MKKNRAVLILLVSQILILGFLVSATTLPAQLTGYPNPENPFVNDFARVMTTSDIQSVQQLFIDLKNQTTIEADVVTIYSIKDYKTGDSTIESFATNLFNFWGIGDAQKNNGVLILVATGDRECQITLGSGFDRQMNAAMQQVVDQYMVPNFKNGDYSRGIADGARAVVGKLTGKVSPGLWISGIILWATSNLDFWTVLLGVVALACFFAGISCMHSGKTGWGWAFFAVSGTILLGILKLFLEPSSGSQRHGGYRSSGGRSSFGGGRSFGGGAHGKW